MTNDCPECTDEVWCPDCLAAEQDRWASEYFSSPNRDPYDPYDPRDAYEPDDPKLYALTEAADV